MNYLKKYWHIAIIIIVAAVLIVATKNNRPNQSPIATNQPQLPITANPPQVIDANPTTTPMDMDVSVWKTYRNEEYGFEIRYPNSWIYKIPSPSEGFSIATFVKDERNDDGSIEIAPMGNPDHLALDTWIRQQYKEKPNVKSNEVIINDIRSMQVQYDQNSELPSSPLIMTYIPISLNTIINVVLNIPTSIKEVSDSGMYDSMIRSFTKLEPSL